MTTSRTARIVALILALSGVLFGHWVLVLCGIVLALLCGNWVAALSLAVLADLLFGQPTGVWHFLSLPFTLLVVLVAPLRVLFMRQLRSNAPNHL